MSEELKKRLKEYQKNYCEAKKYLNIIMNNCNFNCNCNSFLIKI